MFAVNLQFCVEKRGYLWYWSEASIAVSRSSWSLTRQRIYRQVDQRDAMTVGEKLVESVATWSHGTASRGIPLSWIRE